MEKIERQIEKLKEHQICSERQQTSRQMDVEDPERPYSDVMLTISARFVPAQ